MQTTKCSGRRILVYVRRLICDLWFLCSRRISYLSFKTYSPLSLKNDIKRGTTSPFRIISAATPSAAAMLPIILMLQILRSFTGLAPATCLSPSRTTHIILLLENINFPFFGSTERFCNDMYASSRLTSSLGNLWADSKRTSNK